MHSTFREYKSQSFHRRPTLRAEGSQSRVVDSPSPTLGVVSESNDSAAPLGSQTGATMTLRFLVLAFFTCSFFRITFAQAPDTILCKYELDNALEDNSLGDEVRDAFEDDDGRALKSIAIDLNGDSKPEKLVPNEFLCGNGGCPWIVYSPTVKRVIGKLFANRILVLTTVTHGYNVLKCSWSGSGQTKTAIYVFNGKRYTKR